MGLNFKETAHLRTDKDKFDKNFDKIFKNRQNCECNFEDSSIEIITYRVCEICGEKVLISKEKYSEVDDKECP